jgi:hypothetical protein
VSNTPFCRTVVNPLEEPLCEDINRAQSEIDVTIREVLKQLYLVRSAIYPEITCYQYDGFVGRSFKVKGAGDMTVHLTSGIGFITSSTVTSGIGGVGELNDLSMSKPVILNADTDPIVVPAADPANPRWDIVEVRTNMLLTEPTSMNMLNPSSGVFEPGVVNKSLDWSLDDNIGTVIDPAPSTAAIGYKKGIAAAIPVEPTVTPGYTKIAAVYVAALATLVTNAEIIDYRKILAPYGILNVASHVTMPAGSLVVTMNSLFAPHGVVVAAIGIATNPIEVDFYLFAGTPDVSALLPVAIANILIGTVTYTYAVATVSAITVDAALQTALAGANASPQAAISVGQTGYKIAVKSPGSAAAANAYIDLNVIANAY